MPEELSWPPSREELKRLCLVGKLSAARIAERYGLNGRYRTPKVAESTALHQLKKLGVERRYPAERIRRVTEDLANKWIRRYEAGDL